MVQWYLFTTMNMGDNFDYSSAMSGQGVSPLPAFQMGVVSPDQQQQLAIPDVFPGNWDLAVNHQLQELGGGGQQVAIQNNLVVNNVAGVMDYPNGGNVQSAFPGPGFTPDMGIGYPPPSHLQLVDGPLGGQVDTGNTPLSPGNGIPDLFVVDFGNPSVVPKAGHAALASGPGPAALAAGPTPGYTQHWNQHNWASISGPPPLLPDILPPPSGPPSDFMRMTATAIGGACNVCGRKPSIQCCVSCRKHKCGDCGGLPTGRFCLQCTLKRVEDIPVPPDRSLSERTSERERKLYLENLEKEKKSGTENYYREAPAKCWPSQGE